MSDRSQYDLSALTTGDFEDAAKGGKLVILLPVGSVEPHGPHMSLVTDTVISRAAADRAAPRLHAAGYVPRIAPSVPYGVTNCAEGFAGAISIRADALTGYLRAVIDGFVASGAVHVCVINNHLEPEHDQAVRAAIDGIESGRASVACPLTRRWGRTLSDEFKSGACHAGRYETSLILAAEPSLVDGRTRAALPEVPISLSDALKSGVSKFRDMGLDRAYAGDPAAATAEEGDQLLDRLADMIIGEIEDALALSSAP